MIEFCSRKRMAVAIVILFSLTMVTLVVEGMWSTNHKLAELNVDADNESKTQCGSVEVKLIHKCQPCTTYEQTMKSAYCVKTGYKEEVKCGKDGPSFQRSCKADRWVEEKKFWIYQLVTCLIGFGSYGIVKYRQSNLDKTLTEKVNRQIAA